MKNIYVQAVLKAIADGIEPDALLTRLQAVMHRRGHSRLLPTVLRAVLRELTASKAKRTLVRVANESAFSAYKDEIEAALSKLKATESPQHIIDQSLIGGYQVEANYQRVDASYKQKLVSLYRSLTTY